MRGNLSEDPTSGQILLGQSDGTYMPRTMSGDGTIDENGVLTTGGGGGGIGGSGTAGFIPQFSAATTITNSEIDSGVTSENTLFVNASGVSPSNDSGMTIVIGSNGLFIDAVGGDIIPGSEDGPIYIVSGTELFLTNGGAGGTHLEDFGGSGIAIRSTNYGSIGIQSGNAANITADAGIELSSTTGILLQNPGSDGIMVTDTGTSGVAIQAQGTGGAVFIGTSADATSGIQVTDTSDSGSGIQINSANNNITATAQNGNVTLQSGTASTFEIGLNGWTTNAFSMTLNTQFGGATGISFLTNSGTMDFGVSISDQILINGIAEDEGGGVVILGSSNGVTIDTVGGDYYPSNNGAFNVYSGASVQIEGQTGTTIVDETGILIQTNGGGGTTIYDEGGGGLFLQSQNDSVSVPGIVIPNTIFNQGSLPAATIGVGSQGVVNDALAPSYMGAYVGGGTVTCAVISDGANWFTH